MHCFFSKSHKHVRSTPEACQKHTRSMPGACQLHARSIPESCQRHVRSTPGACNHPDGALLLESCKSLVLENALVGRICCFSSRPDKHDPFKVLLDNHVFSSMPTRTQVHTKEVESSPAPEDWRRGCWGKGKKQWDTNSVPLPETDETVPTRQQKAMEVYLPHVKIVNTDWIALMKKPTRQARRQERRQLQKAAGADGVR